MKIGFSLLIGFLLIFGSIIFSIQYGFPYWYSFYVIGAFLFFGALNYRMRDKTLYSWILDGKWDKFFSIYIIAVVWSFILDVVYGRLIGDLWYYPHLTGIYDYLIPILFYYPFGGFQVYEIYHFVKNMLKDKVKDKNKYEISKPVKNIVTNILILFMFIGLIIPLMNYFLNGNQKSHELMIIIMILTTFSFDAINYKIQKKSILFGFLQGNLLVILTMMISWFLAMSLTELPNIFSWEWIYHNIPFTSFEIFHINVIIFTFGWFFLVYIPVTGIDILRKFMD